MKNDPFELENVYAKEEYKAVAEKMQAELFNQMEAVDEPGLKNSQKYIVE